MKTFFQNIDNVSDLKTEYKNLAKKLHPDVGGCAHQFQLMKYEYEKKLQQLQTDRDKLKKLLRSIVNSPFFDDVILPGLIHSKNKYSKLLLDNEKLIKIMSDDPEQAEFYRSIIGESVEMFDIKQFLNKILA